jgi:glycosyltransferase involved in cell wall biosynthesis
LTVVALRRSHPQLAGKLHDLPAGITLGNAPCRLRERLAVAARELLLLCPAGIRPVKGIIELFDLLDPLLEEGRPLRLALCGPILDGAYGDRVFAALASRPWATYLGTIPPEAMPSAMREADIIVSNSASEGLPNALVEAATLGRPIVARAIPGNAAVVTDGGNGLLFADADGFRAAIRRLGDEPALYQALSRPDPERFSPGREATALEAICRQILGIPPGACARQMC